MIKEIEFMGKSLETIREFPDIARRETGQQLDRVQRGLDPVEWKPMPSIGMGVREIIVKQQGQFRTIYVTKFNNVVYVLHAFSKKTQKTRQHDLDIAKNALKEIIRWEKNDDQNQPKI
jgi:phage-related protein